MFRKLYERRCNASSISIVKLSLWCLTIGIHSIAAQVNLSNFQYLVGFWECTNIPNTYIQWKYSSNLYEADTYIKYKLNYEKIDNYYIKKNDNTILFIKKNSQNKFTEWNKLNYKNATYEFKSNINKWVVKLEKINSREMVISFYTPSQETKFYYKKTKSRSVKFN